MPKEWDESGPPRQRLRSGAVPVTPTPEPEDDELRQVVERLKRATERLTAVTGKHGRQPTDPVAPKKPSK